VDVKKKCRDKKFKPRHLHIPIKLMGSLKTKQALPENLLKDYSIRTPIYIKIKKA
jgi:hypothetical protein